jgi:hypothetical protein
MEETKYLNSILNDLNNKIDNAKYTNSPSLTKNKNVFFMLLIFLIVILFVYFVFYILKPHFIMTEEKSNDKKEINQTKIVIYTCLFSFVFYTIIYISFKNQRVIINQ